MLYPMKKSLPQQQLGEKLSEALQDANVTQAELARQCGVTPQAVHDWIRTGRIGKQHLLLIAHITKKPLEYFLVGLGRAAAIAMMAVAAALFSGLSDNADAGSFSHNSQSVYYVKSLFHKCKMSAISSFLLIIDILTRLSETASIALQVR